MSIGIQRPEVVFEEAVGIVLTLECSETVPVFSEGGHYSRWGFMTSKELIDNVIKAYQFVKTRWLTVGNGPPTETGLMVLSIHCEGKVNHLCQLFCPQLDLRPLP